jgi:hypothetical protein
VITERRGPWQSWCLRTGRAARGAALLELYVPQPDGAGSTRSSRAADDVLVSDLAVTEIVSALARRLDQEAIARESVGAVREALLERLDEGGTTRQGGPSVTSWIGAVSVSLCSR